MKKSIIVLLIAILVAGFAFAGTLKGSAGLEFNVDLQPETAAKGIWGFKNASDWKYSFTFEFDSTAVEVQGAGDLWAELAISGSATGIINGDKASIDDIVGIDAVKKNGTFVDSVSVKISKANIHIGEDITIGILNEGEGPDFAWSYYKTNGAPTRDYVKDDHESANIGGFTVLYKDWYGGFAARGRWDTDPAQFTFYGHGLTPEFKFADDQIAVQAGGYAAYSNTDAVFDRASFAGAGASATYAADKLNAYVGADAMYDAGIAFEALASASYAINEDGAVGADAYVVDGQTAYNDKEKLSLDADVWAEYNLAVNDDISVALTAKVDARRILLDTREITVSATQETTIDKIGISLVEQYAIYNKLLLIDAFIDYTADKFYAWTEVTPMFAFDDDPALFALGFECGISTDAIIDKAELGLKYTGADFAKAGDTVADKGLVTAYVKIGFDSSK